MKPFRLRSTIATPGAGPYAAGDEISNHATAGSVARVTYNMAGFTRGRIFAAELDVTPASGNVVTAASDFELLVFKTANVPAAVGDNVTHPIAAATRALAVARFRFDDTGWTGPLGTVAAGTSQVQAVTATLVQPLASNVLEYPWPAGFPFDFAEDETHEFTVILRALAAWDPFGAGPAIVNTFGVTLDLEAA